MKKAFIFPGQGAQYIGMGKDLYEAYPTAREMFEQANEILGFRITDIMFEGQAEDLKRTTITQPAVFLHSVIASQVLTIEQPDMVAGHSLGEYSALVACNSLSFENALKLVSKRAEAMQKACDAQESTMAAVLGMADEKIEEICQQVTDQIVVAANFNCPGQVVISGTIDGIEQASKLLQEHGAKRTIRLQVDGAFHSPLMQPAKEELEDAIIKTTFNVPTCPIYQNVNAYPQSDAEIIKQNLLSQLTAPVRWTQTVKNMLLDGAEVFHEFGPGAVLSGLIRKIDSNISTVQN